MSFLFRMIPAVTVLVALVAARLYATPGTFPTIPNAAGNVFADTPATSNWPQWQKDEKHTGYNEFVLQDTTGDFVYDPQVGIEIAGNGSKVTFTLSSGSDNIRYDSSTGEYLVNLHTSSYPFMTPGPIYAATVYSASVARSLDTVNFILISGGKATGKNS